MSKYQKRAFQVSEMRVDSAEGKPPVLRGHAAVFDIETKISSFFSDFIEVVKPGAFTETIGKDDIRALFNHDPNFVLGRNRSSTLSLSEDSKGLAVEITPPESAQSAHLIENIRRGDISQMSFGFQTLDDRWSGKKDGVPVRELVRVKLFDVSPVTFPAYTETDISVRSYLESLGLESDPTISGLMKLHRGLEPGKEEIDALKRSHDLLEKHFSKNPNVNKTVSILRRRLDLAARQI